MSPADAFQQDGGREEFFQAFSRDVECYGWSESSLATCAEECQIPFSKVYHWYPTKGAWAADLAERINQAYHAALPLPFEASDSAHDRLLCMIVTRFEQAAPYKKLLLTLWRTGWHDAVLLQAVLPLLHKPLQHMLDMAGLSTAGVVGALRFKLFAAAYLRIFYTWQGDASQDLAATTAVADQTLHYLLMVPGYSE